MTWVDWAIVIVLAVTVIGGLTQGLFRSVCSLAGLIFGLLLAAWNYGRVLLLCFAAGAIWRRSRTRSGFC